MQLARMDADMRYDLVVSNMSLSCGSEFRVSLGGEEKTEECGDAGLALETVLG